MESNPEIEIKLRESILKLFDYCNQNNWAGYDPYDGLNSRIFSALPFLQNRICRLIFIQAMKRSPINFRPIFLVPKGENPKGLAVFCSALLVLSDIGLMKNDETILHLLNRLIDLKSPNYPYYCWGYNFDWQSRAFFLPKFAPNIICTTFAGNALVDAYNKFKDHRYIEMAISAGDFILNGLNITRTDNGICFSYNPFDQGQVHNANFLGAAFLARLYSITGDKKFLEPAHSAICYSISKQNTDGSWPYGEDKTQQWTDNFHTGYNLVALKRYSEFAGNSNVMESIRKGFQFYINNFFTADVVPKYYHNKTYPIDIHSIAWSIITLVEFKQLNNNSIDLASSIFAWSLKEMQSADGYFIYQSNRTYKNKISYMRWSQAWMLLALATIYRYLSI